MAAFLPGIYLPQIFFRVSEIAGIGVPRIRLWFDQKRNTPRRELLMQRVHPLAAFHLNSRHGAPPAPLRRPRRQMQGGLHMIHLPQGQGYSGGEEVSETRRQAAQLETYPVAIELNGMLEVLDQQAEVADRNATLRFTHELAWKCSLRREC